MNFERGKDPKEALKIGKRADAKAIVGVAEISVEMDSGPDRIYVRRKKAYNRVQGESHILRVLLGIQAGELNPVEHAVEIGQFGNSTPFGLPHFSLHGPDYIDMSDLLGEFVKYRDEYYKIPTYDEIRKMRESRQDHGIGHIRLH
jgi:hypothetical protein